jgi:hypothetical protein
LPQAVVVVAHMKIKHQHQVDQVVEPVGVINQVALEQAVKVMLVEHQHKAQVAQAGIKAQVVAAQVRQVPATVVAQDQ